MNANLTGANIVIVASSFNPSIVSKDWLFSKGIINEPSKNFTHTPGFSFFESEHYSMTLLPERFLLELKNEYQTRFTELISITERFVSRLPETPYTAIGTNYTWQTETLSKRDVEKKLEDIFTFNRDRFSKIFKQQEVRIGTTVWLNHESFFVKLSIEPHLETMKHILCNFNYHANIKGSDELNERLAKIPVTLTHSENIVKGLFEWQ